jgi:intein/homing endonuclease
MVEGTKIQTIDGLKEIQDITVGEIVHTLDGEKMVTHTWTPETLEFGEPECYEIEFEDGHIVTVSNQHPFLTKNGWIDAEDLTIGSEVLKRNLERR